MVRLFILTIAWVTRLTPAPRSLRQRMTATRDSLAPSVRRDAQAKPPYAFNQMDEKAIQREILIVYDCAKPETKILYVNQS